MISQTIQNTKRELLRLQTYSKFYIVLVLIVLVVFGVFGAVPLGIAAKDKLALLGEMNATNEVLEKKVNDLNVAKTILDDNELLIQEFYSYLPENYTIQDYLTDLT